MREAAGGLTPQKLKLVTDCIAANLTRKLALADLAAVAGISAFHLAHLFKQSTGLALHQYIVKMRLERAAQLLTETNLGIGEIARRVGYTHSRFSELFHRQMGTTPGAFRAARK